MKLCPRCNQAHTANGRFCSRSCANSRVFSDEAKLKKSIANKGKPYVQGWYDKDKATEKRRETWLSKYLDTPFEQLGMANRRRRVFEEQNFCCADCGIGEWRGFKINLELEHIDGNTSNNDRENLKGLCPNCHSLTETWRGRNKPSRNGQNIVDDKTLLDCLRSSPNIRQGLLKAGLAAKGMNYERAKKLLIDKDVDI